VLLFRIALRNLSRRGRKTLVVAVLIAVGVGAFFAGNAVLESSVGGLHSAFSENFTADLSLSARSEQSFSIFGPDVPIIGDYESEPPIVSAADVGNRVTQVPGVESIAYVLSSPLLLEVNGTKAAGLGLGVIGDEYFSFFRAPRFIAGAPPANGSSGWAVITDEWAREISAAQGHPLSVGDTVQVSLFRNQTFTIRDAVLCGIIRYQPGSEALRHVLITDGRIIRALCGFSQTDAGSPAAGRPVTGSAASSSDSIDSLFSSPSSDGVDNSASSSKPITLGELKDLLNEAYRAGAAAKEPALGHDGAWHFILVRTAAGANKTAIASEIRRVLSEAGMVVQVRDWRGTAGGVATYVFLVQVVLYIGMILLAGIAVILTVNSVVMSVFERTPEIGTMRAVGAQKGFVRGLLLIETCTLTLVSGIAGIFLGIGIVAAVRRVPFHFHNQILVLLFGGTALHPTISAGNLLASVLAAFVIGLAAWIYPVRVALRIQPVRAIHAS
jgi:ABC-type lipoprotein release transport system permease subunit